jgi:hypothetical protein
MLFRKMTVYRIPVTVFMSLVTGAPFAGLSGQAMLIAVHGYRRRDGS